MATQAQIDELEAAVASGILSVKTGEQEVTYQNIDAMKRALDQLRSEAGQNVGRVTLAEFSRD